MNKFVLDGKEGGGSVIRVGIPLALAQNRPINVINVRHARKRKGLQTQHLIGINMLSTITGCQIQGATVGSSEITVIPGSHNRAITPNNLPKIQIPTSASVSLVIQTLANYAFAARRQVGFEFSGGGSHVNYSPNFDVLTRVNGKLFELFGLKMWIQLDKPGFYPKGGARGRVFMKPVEANKVEIEKTELESIDLISSASSFLQQQNVAERQIEGFKKIIPDVNDTFSGYAPSLSPGSSLSAIINFRGPAIKAVANNLDQDISPEQLGKDTAKETKREINNPAAIDDQLADQLLVPLSYAPKGSSFTFKNMVQHVDTNLKVIETVLGNRLTVEKLDNYFKVSRN